MEFKNLVRIIFHTVPAFKTYITEEPNENYSNAFLGDFGLFTKKATKTNENYSSHCFILINDLYNCNSEDKEFINQLKVNILEILTDIKLTQEASIKYFDGKCLETFIEMINTNFYNLLDN